ncbi:MAG: hypothetical protein EA361_19885 [Bacteroidetes bacterium]|nr:MAG: hypothetical protein EA361_19885 [Bacteroidota bacterium]
MSTKSASKINRLLQNVPKGVVLQSSWLLKQGYSHDLQQSYLKSNWLVSIGTGAYKRAGDDVTVFGALYALQHQAEKKIHIGGLSSLSLQGLSHYVAMGNDILHLFANPGFKLPKWFIQNQWNRKYMLKTTNLLPPDLSLIKYDFGAFQVKISSPARAMMEYLDSAPEVLDLEEAWLIMESMNNLPPAQVQELLEHNQSIKTKRLFLFLAEKAEHAWFKKLNIAQIDMGSGKRSIVKNGVFIKKYQITVPEIIAQ